MTDVDLIIKKAIEAVKPNSESDGAESSSDDDETMNISSEVAQVNIPSSKGKEKNKKNKADRISLSSTLQHGIADPNGGVYIDTNGNAKVSQEYLKSLSAAERLKKNAKSCEELAREAKGPRQLQKERRLEREKTKGRDWFNLPAPEMTEQLKNDLTVLQMRKVLDPKRFYKGPDIRGALPKYFQMGRVVETPADFYSGRIPKKQQKSSLVDELLDDADFRRYNKRKYEEIQAKQPRTFNKAYKHMKKLKKHKR